VSDGSSGRGPRSVVRWARDRLRTVGRIARWEVRRSVGVLDRRTAALALVALLLAGAVGGAALALGGGAYLLVRRGVARVDVAG